MKKVVIFGAGRRVQSHIVPAVVNCSDNLSLSAIYARRQRILSICDEEYEVNILDKSTSSNLKDSDIVVICVSQESVSDVLLCLLKNNCSDKEIFIDTPVFSGKNIRDYSLIKKFKHIFVLEDWLALNKFDLATSLIKYGKIGKVKKICFFHSGYRHHAIAISRRWTGAQTINSIKHKKYTSNFNEFHLRDNFNVITWILEPRDYEFGSFLIIGESGTISDYAIDAENHHFIETKVLDNKLVTSIICDDTEVISKSFLVNRVAEIPFSGMNFMDVMKIDALSKILCSESSKYDNNLRYPVLEAVYDKLLIDLSRRWGRFYDIPFWNNGFIKYAISWLSYFSKTKK